MVREATSDGQDQDGEVILQVTAIGPTGNIPIPQKR
jgi:hypothetical protein